MSLLPCENFSTINLQKLCELEFLTLESTMICVKFGILRKFKVKRDEKDFLLNFSNFYFLRRSLFSNSSQIRQMKTSGNEKLKSFAD